MRPLHVMLLLFLSMTVCSPQPTSASPRDGSRIAGQWALNRELSQLPREIGFRVDWLTKGDSGEDSGLPTPLTFNQQPDPELKGLTNLGIVVEDLSPQAAACGLNQGTLETDLSKPLTDAGFKVRTNSDEDTYLYVNVITSSLPNGLCVSRYDAFLYTHTMAKLSYQATPTLVQVSLLHKGGIAGGNPASHGAAVLRGLHEYVDQFVTRIQAANK